MAYIICTAEILLKKKKNKKRRMHFGQINSNYDLTAHSWHTKRRRRIVMGSIRNPRIARIHVSMMVSIPVCWTNHQRRISHPNLLTTSGIEWRRVHTSFRRRQTISYLQHRFRRYSHLYIYSRRQLMHGNSSCLWPVHFESEHVYPLI